MDGYREFWNRLIYFNDGAGPLSLERYWITLAVFGVICFAIGVVALRARFLAAIATVVIVGAYVAALAPFMVRGLDCGGCGSSMSYDSGRSFEALYLHMYWGGVFTMGLATLWIGVLLSRGVAALFARQGRSGGANTGVPHEAGQA